MPILHLTKPTPGRAGPSMPVEGFPGGTWADELDYMVARVRYLVLMGDPGELMSECMAYMGRLTEIALDLVRHEDEDRKLKHFRTTEVERVIDFIMVSFRGASRMVELRRQELDSTR